MSVHPISVSYPAAAAAARPSLQPTTLADRCWRARVLVAAQLGRTALR